MRLSMDPASSIFAGGVESGRAKTYASMMLDNGDLSINQQRSNAANNADFLDSLGICAEEDAARNVSAPLVTGTSSLLSFVELIIG